MFSLYKRKDGYWAQSVPIYTPQGTKYKTVYAKTPQELKQKIKQTKKKAENGSEKFTTVAELWIESSAKDMSPNTENTYRMQLRKAEKHFKNKDITEITPQDIDAFFQNYAFTYRPSKSTAYLMRAVLNKVFAYAVAKGYALYNPCREIQVPKNLKKKTIEMPSSDEIAEIKKHADTDFGLLMNILLYTGLRKSEALALTWEDFDFTNRWINIDKSLYSHGSETPIIKSTKTENSMRKVPIIDKLYDILPKNKKGIVFKNRKDNSYWTDYMFSQKQREYRKQTGITANCHQLRHGFATVLIEQNIEPQDARIILGHKNVATTINIYTQVRENRIKQLQDRVKHIDVV